MAATKKHKRKSAKVKLVKSLGLELPAITKIDPDGLTPKERLFVSEWLIDKNATRAYRAAGYKAKNDNVAAVRSHHLLRDSKIAVVVQRELACHAVRLEISADKVLREYARIAFADARDLYREDGSLKQPHEWDDDVAATIGEVEVEEEFSGRGDKRELSGYTRKIHRWDKLRALDKLTKHLGICLDRQLHEHTGVVVQEHWAAMDLVALLPPDVQERLLEEYRKRRNDGQAAIDGGRLRERLPGPDWPLPPGPAAPQERLEDSLQAGGQAGGVGEGWEEAAGRGSPADDPA